MATRSPGSLWVEVVESADGLAAHVPAWDDLAGRSIDVNAFYESWMMLPALLALGTARTLVFLFVYAANPGRPGGPPLLCGFIPLERRRFKGLPIAVLTLYKPAYCFLCTPLLRESHAVEALQAVFEWARTDRRGAGLLDFSYVPGDGPFNQALVDAVNERAAMTCQWETYNRALMRRAQNAEAYLAGAMSAGHRKELRRLRRRLADMGALESRALQPGDDLQPWIDAFLQLEMSGWKGREQSALGSASSSRDFFVAVARGAFERGRLFMLGLFLDGKPIALKCSFISGQGSFAFKIAYDESFARYSPGVQLEIDNIEALHRRPDLQWMDSCARPRHFMINRLWTERRPIQLLLISTAGRAGDVAVGILPLLRGARRLFHRPRTIAALEGVR
jgi:CelD/BcsL family acetyltransferase involved in cellulose biosynthesis